MKKKETNFKSPHPAFSHLLRPEKVKMGFTLAEVLITLGIIGVVAALTIPTLVANYQAKSWNTAATLFEERLTEAVKTMNVQGKLGSYGGYKTTEGFVEELQKHFKIAKVCDNDHLMECFEDKITMNDKEINMSDIYKSKHFGQEDWNTNIVGIQVANGTSALLAYNPNCKANPYDSNITGSDCYAIVYDTSGFSSPNELGKDLRKNANVSKIADISCVFKINGTCFGNLFLPAPVKWNACDASGKSTDPEDIKLMSELGISTCCGSSSCSSLGDFWAGTIKTCGGIDNMPTKKDLEILANYLYDTTGISGAKSNITLNTNKFMSLGFVRPGYPYVWSGTGDPTAPFIRSFQPNLSNWYSYGKLQDGQVEGLCSY